MHLSIFSITSIMHIITLPCFWLLGKGKGAASSYPMDLKNPSAVFRFEFDDPEFLKFVNMHNHANEGISVCRFYDTFPLAQYLPIFKLSPALRNMKKAVGHFQGYLKRWFVEARENRAESKRVTECGLIWLSPLISGDGENMVQVLANGVNAAEVKAAANGEQEIYSNEEIMHMLMNLFTGKFLDASRKLKKSKV